MKNKKKSMLRIVLLLVGIIAGALSACSSGGDKPPDPIGTIGQGVCAAGSPCTVDGQSCLDPATSTSYVCINGLYQAATGACAENGVCLVPGQLCLTSCGTVLGCNASHVLARLSSSEPMCTDAGTIDSGAGGMMSDAGSTDGAAATGGTSGSGGASGAGGTTTDASGSGGASATGGTSGTGGATDGGVTSDCVTMNDATLCTATNVEGDTICTGDLTCHCGFWMHTDKVAGNPCPVSGTGGAAGTGGTAATGGTSGTGGATATGGTTSTGGTAATGGTSATGGATSTGGSASDGGLNLCYPGNACSPNSTSSLEEICWDTTTYTDILRCCGGTLIVSTLNGACPDAGAGTGGTTSTGGTASTGGASGSGGVAATGGATSTGGTSGTGGAVADAGSGSTLQIAVTPKNTLNGSPVLWATYDDASNVHHDWTTIVPAPTLVVGTTYIFVTGLGSGVHNIVFNVQEPVTASSVGFCWEYDISSNVPCGGNGSNPGVVVATMTGTGTVVPQGTPVSNNQPPGNTVYLNGTIPTVP